MFGVQAAPPGFIMTAKVLLDNNNAPTREEVRDWFQKNRNLCRCTGYKPDVYCLEEMYKKARPLYEAGKKQVAEKTAASDGRYKSASALPPVSTAVVWTAWTQARLTPS